MTIDFKEFALQVARGNGVESLLPVVEKELIHYDIIRALDESRWLDRLIFQGGTCLRLCYGAVRYSEDLDFTTAEDLTETDLLGFSDIVSRELEKKYDVSVRVKEPKKIKEFEGGATMKRWQVVVDTAPARPDLPSQKIKIEIAHVPSYTRKMLILQENYPELEGMNAQVIAGCQSLDEILADKVVSFSQQTAAPRYRDLWDIPWIASQPGINREDVAEMVAMKIADYQVKEPSASFLAAGEGRAVKLLEGDILASEMTRFLPDAVLARTVGRANYREAMAHKIEDVFAFVARSLEAR
ncbi:nucleotidyl transferase AbiEii/AbiGii toxin family protein [uncultured Adlercreutzia sp.]|uniref:nucleotidyl transferase AbiEii/AbiGii toxin family protein n=1 Tax=uncultured Adlercreutzia sp. TaxID=875803 RepID=UPI0026F3B3A2|nr:nucleotidyl transferase AbiEii/AbiGii toxin family protein [uncultured Adlercreutzia sp.]